MDQPLRAFTRNEVWYYLRVTPCPSCGHGPWHIEREDADADRRHLTLRCRCGGCGREMCRTFEIATAPPEQAGALAEVINPTDEPSRLIDLAQWVALFYRLLERAAGGGSKAETRRAGFQAALCLGEALKFYAEGAEQPPASAFFSDASCRAAREHPERFERRRLLDLQGRLPALHVMAANVQRDQRHGRRRWWQFWRR